MASFDTPLGPTSISRIAGSGGQARSLQMLQPDQVYRAIVEQVNAGALVLRIGELNLRATTDLKVVAGQALLVKLNRQTQPHSLEIIRVFPVAHANPQPRPAAHPGRSFKDRIQHLVSRQASPLLLFSLIEDIGDTHYFPDGLRNAIEAISQHLLTPAALANPEALQRAGTNSGMWHEALLRAALKQPTRLSTLSRDQKSALLAMQELRNSNEGLAELMGAGFASTLAQVTDGVLARLNLQQIQSVLEAEQGQSFWTLDLPVRLREEVILIAMTVRREQKGQQQNAAQRSWEVELDTDLPQLGRLRISVFLRQQHLSVSLEAMRHSTVNLFARHLMQLESQLRDNGLKVETLLSRPMPSGSSYADQPWFSNLLEVSA